MAISQACFKWTNYKLTNLIKCLRDLRSFMEFRNFNSTADKAKSYENLRKGLLDISSLESLYI